MMKHAWRWALAATLLTGCAVVSELNTRRMERNNAPGEEWLSDQMEPAQINISGAYRSPDWGMALLKQEGRRVRGHIGDYPVEGVVSGTKAFLLLTESGWHIYSMVLEMPKPGILTGRWSRAVPYRRDFSRDVILISAP